MTASRQGSFIFPVLKQKLTYKTKTSLESGFKIRLEANENKRKCRRRVFS